jgi:hypothetical protein
MSDETSVDLLSKIARLEAVISAADDWRETLSLPQQDLGCEEFQEAWENYDTARAAVADLIEERPECPGCDCSVSEKTGTEGPNGNLWHQHCLDSWREG